MSFLGQEEQLREFQERFKYIYVILFVGFGIMVSRLVYLQIFNGDKMRRYSEENRIKEVRVPAPRGMIFDRNRTLLVDNRPAFDLEITPQYLNEANDPKAILEHLSTLINMPYKSIRSHLKKHRHQPSFLPVKIKTDLSRDEVAKIETWKLDMPGVAVRMEIQRTNIYGDVASHLLGYIARISESERNRLNRRGKAYRLGDSIGKVGIERQLEDILRGEDGIELVEVDALGRRIREKARGRVLGHELSKSATPGKNLILTIDQDLQLAAKEAFGEKIGALVAINPKTGEILSMISRPSFDPTEFSRGISPKLWRKLRTDKNRPLRDKTIQDHYPPGSVFKVVTAIAGLEEGVINEKTTFHCPGYIRVGRKIFHCHRRGGHGNVNVVAALKGSCNVFFHRVAQKLESVDVLAKWARRLGLAKKTGIELDREVPGLIPTEEWKEKRFGTPWTAGETMNVSIGQGFVLTTVLQLANLYGSIANGGTLFKPYFVKAIESEDGSLIKGFSPKIVSQFQLAPKTLELVRKGLWNVVNSPHGTAYYQRLPGMDMAGKTGTVQVISASHETSRKCEEQEFRFRNHGLFAAFAPADDPVIAVAALAEHACHGSSGAGPIARAVIKKYLEKYFPDKYGSGSLATRSAIHVIDTPQPTAPSPGDEE